MLKFLLPVLMGLFSVSCISTPEEVIYEYEGEESFSEEDLDKKLQLDIASCNQAGLQTRDDLLLQEKNHQRCMYQLGWKAKYLF
ncbi:hypothetical protein [Pseudobacteriovorax antillogorgiicola]|uniref:Lipoprotein n=1 Tax=Pseudobacteriovorax antillogorgiicola TaxID=1513793 RepID=A0A1Y6BTY9_9BACT|nr:hypothetical protein [Pseudobacteriovorax antillogorgiicola]TCS52419.1 hypothetical protein EDD56_109164 [Pseudobacteriovorax antillogorgiicola]SMF28806.1 hypothetical protein SAMN06296036_10949 [Pseudobacteriovorax antillogorgiicola]